MSLLGPMWSTTSFGDSVDASPLELLALGEHLDLCQGLRGRWFGLRCAAETMNGLATARIVTTLLLLTLMVSLASLAL